MSQPGRIMGVDHGSARIGIAVSDPLRLFSRPHSVITHSNRAADFAEIQRIINAEEIAKVVVGLPTDSEGGIGRQARIAIRWALALSRSIAVPIILWDESYSSQIAAELENAQGQRTKRHGTRGQPADDVAAAVMLQDYLDAGGAENEPGWPLENLSQYN